MNRLRVLVILSVVVVGLVATSAISFADDPFVCPIVGEGVVNAFDHGAGGIDLIAPAAGPSILPGNEQAGANSNPNAYNDRLPNDPLSGPGDGNSGFTAIWSDNPGTPE